MNNANLIELLTAPTRVGSGDLLGDMAVIPSWVFCFMGCCLLFALYQLVRVFVEINREKQQRRRQRDQCPSQPNNPARLPVHVVGDVNEQPCQMRHLLRCLDGTLRLINRFKFIKLLNNLMRFWRHKRVMPPNAKLCGGGEQPETQPR